MTIVAKSNPASVFPAENHPPRKPIGLHVGSSPVDSNRCFISRISFMLRSILNQFRHGSAIERIAAIRQDTDHIERTLANSNGEFIISSM